MDVDALNRELEEGLSQVHLERKQVKQKSGEKRGDKAGGAAGENTGKSSEKSTEKRKRRKQNKLNKVTNKKASKKTVSPLKVLLVLLCILVCLLFVAAGVFLGLKAKGKKQLQEINVQTQITAPEEVQVEDEGKYVVYNGKKYCYNEDIISILCMGIDKSIDETSVENIGENGQADALVMIVLDTSTGEMSLVNIPRDAMVDVSKYNAKGQYLGTENMQICLSYAYGDGKEKSCENTMEAVSRLMYGMPIHGYAAIDFDCISVLNNAVGGVTVQVLEDLTLVDSQLWEGNTVTLTGEQAHKYVRSRDVEVLDSNNSRMMRQKQYLLAFMQKALAETRENMEVPLALYQAASDYMVTDIGTSGITYLASLVMETGVTEGALKTVPGEVVKGDIYAEFMPEEQGLYQLILDVFYEEIEE